MTTNISDLIQQLAAAQLPGTKIVFRRNRVLISLPLKGLGQIAQAEDEKPLKEKQRAILETLLEKPMTKENLAHRLDCDPSDLHRSHIKPLMEAGMIANSRDKGGYYLTGNGEALAHELLPCWDRARAAAANPSVVPSQATNHG